MLWGNLTPFVILKICCIEVHLTGPDGIKSTKTVRCTEGLFVVSRFDASKLLPVIHECNKALHSVILLSKLH